MDKQQETVLRYHELLDANAAMHVIRVARQSGVLELLRERQRTLAEICEPLELSPKPTQVLLECLTALGAIERYEEDYALASVTRLLTEHDRDLHDTVWQRLDHAIKAPTDAAMPNAEYRHRLATSQWTHTSAAMQLRSLWRLASGGAVGGC